MGPWIMHNALNQALFWVMVNLQHKTIFILSTGLTQTEGALDYIIIEPSSIFFWLTWVLE